jgi:hypothetical protein
VLACVCSQVFYPTEEEFKDFYAYAQKLDRLVGHVGVAKVVPPKGWKARPHDLYNLEDSNSELEEAVQVKRPIRQNAIGSKGLYANVHEVKRSMKLSDFKKTATSKDFAPPMDTQHKELTDEDVDLLERRFWRNVLFNPPLYGADCPAPTGLRSDGKEGLFDPVTCGDWDLAKLPSLLTHGIKKRVPGVNTPFLYVGMYRAAFAWHCEDMDLHSINYLHWGAPKTWYTVPATHGRKLEELACKNFPVQASECKEFLRHKSVMMEPGILLKASIPLTRTVQRPGEFIINFPGAYHSGFNNGYNCAESCNFATEYWIPFGAQAKPCSCAGGKDSVRIDISAMIKKVGVNNVKVKGEQWVQCDDCSKWRLLPPYLMHLVRDDADELSAFHCRMIEGLTCSVKESAAATAEEGEAWEIDGKLQLGLDPDLEQWVMCEQCSKWRRLPPGHALDADATFVCSMLPAVTCQDAEEEADDDDESAGRTWQLMDVSMKRTKIREWTKEDEKRQRLGFLKDELNGYCIAEAVVAECGQDIDALEALIQEAKRAWSTRWDKVHSRWQELARPFRGTVTRQQGQNDGVGVGVGVGEGGGLDEELGGKGVLARREMAARAACVAQKLWLLSVEAEEEKEGLRRAREVEKKRQRVETARAEEARAASAFSAAVCKGLGVSLPEQRVPEAAIKTEEDAGAGAGGQGDGADSNARVVAGASGEEAPEDWRYVAVPVSVIALARGAPPATMQGMDDKEWAAVLKLLSPLARDVRSLHVPRSCPEQCAGTSSQQAAGAQGTSGAALDACTSVQHKQHVPGQQLQQFALAAATAPPQQSAAAIAGWKEYMTGDGKKYYHHAASGTTQWEQPPGWCLAPIPPAMSRPNPVPTPKFDTLHVRAATQGKDGAALDRLLALLAQDASVESPCAVMVRDVVVVVGYWHRDGVESKQRLEGLLAGAAKKVVLDLLVPALKEHLLALAANDSHADGAEVATDAEKAKAKEHVTLAALQGALGVTRVEDFVTRMLWERAAEQSHVRVAKVEQQTCLVVEEAELLADIARAKQRQRLQLQVQLERRRQMLQAMEHDKQHIVALSNCAVVKKEERVGGALNQQTQPQHRQQPEHKSEQKHPQHQSEQVSASAQALFERLSAQAFLQQMYLQPLLQHQFHLQQQQIHLQQMSSASGAACVKTEDSEVALRST